MRKFTIYYFETYKSMSRLNTIVDTFLEAPAEV